jgi:hypothetical protein
MDDKRDEIPTMPVYQAEKIIMHQNFANRRMLIALLGVCLTFILTIVIFVVGYTVREKNWLDTLTRVTAPEVSNGIQQDADH